MDKTAKNLVQQLFQQIALSEFRNDSGKQFIDDLLALIATGNYRDELGHSLTMYKAYEDLRKYVAENK